MTPEQARALHALANEIERFAPVAATFKGMSPVDAARATLRMVVELMRERADGKPDTGRPATDAELQNSMSS